MDKIPALHLMGPKTMFQVLTGSFEHTRGTATENVINVGGEGAHRVIGGSKDRLEAGVQIGGLKAQTRQLEGFL